jgi:hypothetical protein
VTIPARVHFCWIGPRLPWAYVFAILSAAERSGLPEIILHHTDALERGAEASALTGAAGVTLDHIDPIDCLTQVGTDLGVGDRLAALFDGLDSPVKRTDVLRAAILFQQGGIYLDLDTVTVASLAPLLDAVQFVGCEYIVWPGFVRASRSPARWARSFALDLLRKAMCRMPDGWEAFRQVERYCYRSVNNAVMGAEPNAPFFARYLRAMLAVPTERLHEAYSLGPDLLQALVGHDRQGDLTIHDPRVFYPLPPEISRHWFRISGAVRLDKVLSPETRVVHWYASVLANSPIAPITPASVRAQRGRQLYSALVCAYVANLPEAEAPPEAVQPWMTSSGPK